MEKAWQAIHWRCSQRTRIRKFISKLFQDTTVNSRSNWSRLGGAKNKWEIDLISNNETNIICLRETATGSLNPVLAEVQMSGQQHVMSVTKRHTFFSLNWKNKHRTIQPSSALIWSTRFGLCRFQLAVVLLTLHVAKNCWNAFIDKQALVSVFAWSLLASQICEDGIFRNGLLGFRVLPVVRCKL